MTVLLWWKGRLQAGEPLHHPDPARGVDVRFRDGGGPNGWPHAVAKQKLYDDYLWWHNSVYLKPFRESHYYQDNPNKMPQAAERLPFFSMIQPLLQPTGIKARTYPVKVNTMHDGRLLKIKRSRSFFRLAPLEEHRMAFNLHTGIPLGTIIKEYDAREIALLAAEQKRIR